MEAFIGASVSSRHSKQTLNFREHGQVTHQIPPQPSKAQPHSAGNSSREEKGEVNPPPVSAFQMLLINIFSLSSESPS